MEDRHLHLYRYSSGFGPYCFIQSHTTLCTPPTVPKLLEHMTIVRTVKGSQVPLKVIHREYNRYLPLSYYLGPQAHNLQSLKFAHSGVGNLLVLSRFKTMFDLEIGSRFNCCDYTV